ncbi:SigE family RNA polymerase sigma factor [Streptomyces sp. J2-1]|nr:SigE family RNA polymerase sigma factor [Streptomyces corallincola]
MGDRKARDEEFQSFMVGRWSRMMRTAFLLTGEQHAAEDLVQSTLEQVYVAWRRVGSADDPEAYVRRVMINAHARRHRRRLKEFLAPKDDSGLLRELPDTADGIARADDRGALLIALARLPARQREAVVQRPVS